MAKKSKIPKSNSPPPKLEGWQFRKDDEDDEFPVYEIAIPDESHGWAYVENIARDVPPAYLPLLMSAPALLAAVKRLLDAMESVSGYDWEASDDWEACQSAARDAVKLAEGK